MRTLDLFVVELDKKLNDTITTKGGLELYIDSKFNEFENRVTEGPVVAAPSKYETGVEPGDTLYFHHLVVVNEGQALTGHEKHYLVRYNPEHTVNNQAIGYKSAKSGEIQPLAGWALLEPVEQDQEPGSQSDLIEVVKLKEPVVRKARVAFNAPWIEELGVSVGDVVGIKKNRDYEIIIDGKKYFRVRAEDFLYVEQ
jgi:co-chaperonin GroES (HSP10)